MMKILNLKFWKVKLISLILIIGLPISALADHDVEKRIIKIQMEDGIELAADLFIRPNDGPLPCIVVRTPYGRYQHEPEGEYWASCGYNVLIQDARGKWDSEGDFYPFINEKKDGLETLDWVIEQDWCDGRIGLWGSSYLSHCAFVLAAENHPAIKSAFLVSGWLTGKKIINPGGAMHLQLSLPWILHEETQKRRYLGNYEIEDMFNHLPLIDAFSGIGIESKIWTDRFMDWEAETRDVTTQSITIPIHHVTGWWDFVSEASLDIYTELVQHSSELQKLTVGPWFHDQLQTDYTEAGDADYGPGSAMGRVKLNELTVAWFDHTIKGVDNGVDREPRVRYFQMGENEWKESDSWPPHIEETPMYLSSVEGANSRFGDGILSSNQDGDYGTDGYLFNPNNPVPTMGGDNFHFFLHLIGLKDQSDIEERKDILVYTSEPLSEPLELAGPVKMKLFVSTEGKDTDFTAKLVDVHESGYAGIMMDGIRRLSFRESTETRSEVIPGKIYEIEIELGYLAYTFPVGHSIRIEISSSNFPKFERNPNTGEEAWHAEVLKPVNQTIYMGEVYPSRIILPVVSNNKVVDPELQAGIDLYNAGEIDRAIEAFNKLLEKDRNNSIYHLWAGKANLEKVKVAANFERGIVAGKVQSHLQKVIKLDPQNIEARQHLSSYYLNAPSIAGGSVKKAKQMIEEILALNPNDPLAHYQLGMFCQNVEDYTSALECFQKALELDDEFYGALYQVGRTAVMANSYLDLGIESFKEYINAEQDDPVPSLDAAWWRLGMAYQLKGERDEARSSFEKALELKPGDEKYLDALENL